MSGQSFEKQLRLGKPFIQLQEVNRYLNDE